MSVITLPSPLVNSADEAESIRREVAALDSLARALNAAGVREVPASAENAWQLLADLATGGVRCHAA